MKHFLFILSVILFCSCGADETLKELTKNDSPVETRAVGDYVFYANEHKTELSYTYNNDSIPLFSLGTIWSNKDIGEEHPQSVMFTITSVPSWAHLYTNHVYDGINQMFLSVDANVGSERVGLIRLKQAETNRIITIEIKQLAYYNHATISTKKLSDTEFEITATTEYPSLDNCAIVFGVHYKTFWGTGNGTGYNMITILPNENTGSVRINHAADMASNNASFIDIFLTEVIVHTDSPDQYHYVVDYDEYRKPYIY